MGLGDHGLGIGFPVPQMGIRHWMDGGALSEELVRDKEEWERALQHARRARQLSQFSHEYVDYLIGRLEFGIGYLEMVSTLKRAGEANKKGDRTTALELLEQGVSLSRRIVTVFARIAMPAYDLGTLIQLNEDLYRKLSRLLADAQTGKSWTLPVKGVGGDVLVESKNEK